MTKTTPPTVRSEELAPYTVERLPAVIDAATADDDETIRRALSILEKRLRVGEPARAEFSLPRHAKDYLRLRLAELEHEVFTVLFLDAHHRLIAAEELFRGTLTQASVYPREVVKRALAHNAAAVLLSHNHPSGVAEPSRADEYLTTTLRTALALVDVRVLDHLVVGHSDCVSFAERGLL